MPLFKTGTEALHDVAWSSDYNNNGAGVTATATVFPQALGLASTWDTELIQQVGSAVGVEARGLNAQNPIVWGLNLWAPVVNLLRDPRWGRNEEGYSEDALLTGAISSAYSKGISGPHPRYLQAAPTLKHFLAYNNEVRRDTTSSSISPRVLHEYDLKAFEPAIRANVATGVMASYNLVNGRPNHVSADLLDLARSWTNRDLMVVSDAYAPYNLTGSEAYYATQPEADAAAIKAGLDSFTVDDTHNAPMIAAIQAALAGGLLAESDIDEAVHHNLSIRFRLGEFDPPELNPYTKITLADVNTAEHQQLARKTAREAIVLLKNEGNVLPLDAATVKKVAVIGPLAQTLYTDWYSGSMPYGVTPAQGMQERLGVTSQVAVTEGSDRIALKDVTSGLYVTAATDPAGQVLTASSASAGANESFDLVDWGEGVFTLRSVANSKYVARSWSTVLVNSDTQPMGWFVMEQFKFVPQPDNTYVIEYAGYEVRESWYGNNKYVVVGADGQLSVTAATIESASRFTLDVLASGVESAAQAATGADAAVVVLGSMPFINGRENRDRVDITLAAGQEALVKAVLAANPHTILVIENSYPTAITWENGNVPAILWTTHAGQETGHALADVIFGDVSPAGRLTQTWYRSVHDLPDILDYDIISSDRTYMYFKGTPLFPFGHGLTYATFAYDNLKLSSWAVGQHGSVTVSVDVTNKGARVSDEVVQLYTHQRFSRVKQPVKVLRVFERLHDVQPGEMRTVRMRLNASDLAFWDVTSARPVIEFSTHDIEVGRSSADIRAATVLAVNGEIIPPAESYPRDPRRELRRPSWYDAGRR